MKNLITVFLFLISFTSFLQGQDYFVVNNEKTYCSDLNYETTSQSYLKSISYTDNNGKKIVIEGRNNVPAISTFFINGVIIDKIPQKANKPDKYIKWAERVVDGKLIVNLYQNEMTVTKWRKRGPASGFEEVTTGLTKYFIKMPDGTYYDVTNNKDRKKHIFPYLQKCAKLSAQYNGDIESEFYKRIRKGDLMKEFNGMIELYNELCE